MSPTKNQIYCLADRIFFDRPSRMHDEESRFREARRTAPDGWLLADQELWRVVNPTGAVLPAQGWKIHVSATLGGAEQVIDRVWEYCVAKGVAFKFLRSRSAMIATNSKNSYRGGSGKLVTLYPADERQLSRTLIGLSEVLAGFAGPYILSDLRYGDGPLYVRYGAFREMYCYDAAGEPVHALYDADGALVPDVRDPVFTVPDWVTLPDILRPHLAARQATPEAEFPYVVRRALHFSNAGGVYLATERDTGREVVLREARPHAGLDREENDAITRLERERAALAALDGLDCVPRLLDHRVLWEHHFLVEEFIEGETLLTAVLERHPLAHPDPTPADLVDYHTWAMGVVDQVAEAVRAIHGRGIRYGDLHANNVLIRPDGRVALVDFELAVDRTDAPAPGLVTAGFAAPADMRGADVDWYALDCLRLFLLMPMTQIVDRDPAKAWTLVDAANELFAGAGLLSPHNLPFLLRDDRGVGDRVAARFAADPVDWPAIRDSLVAGIHANATPDRPDRLFPGDPAQFVTSGVTLASGAAGVLYAMHRVGETIPNEYVDWLARTALGDLRTVRRGLYDGLHGVAYVLDLLGREEQARQVLDRARTMGDRVPAAGLYGGRAGIALNLLHFARTSGDATMRDAAVMLGEDLAALVDGTDAPADLRTPDDAGLMRGFSGLALCFLHLYGDTGETRYLRLAETALRRDLAACEYLPDGTLQVHDKGSYLPYLDYGSAGIAMVLREYLRYAEDTELAGAVAAVRRALHAPFCFQPGLLRGRAGLLATLCHLGEPADQQAVRDHVRRFGWYVVSHDGNLAVPGSFLQRLSMDLATGSAGVLLALHAAVDGTGSVLPYLDTRAPVTTSARTVGT